VFGAGNVTYGSDYSHTIGDMAGVPLAPERAARALRDKVRGATPPGCSASS